MDQEIYLANEFKSLIPALAPEEYAQLEKNILADGCIDPLLLWNEILLDGHNRYEICQKHGLPFRTEQITTLKTFDDATLWIIQHQLGRRNISDFARAELALKAKPIIQARAKENLSTSTGGTEPRPLQNSAKAAPVHTNSEIAKAAGVSRDTVNKVERIAEIASRAVVQAARAGEVSINTAAKIATLPKERQEALVAAGPQEMKKVAAEIRMQSRAPIHTPKPPIGEASKVDQDDPMRHPKVLAYIKVLGAERDEWRAKYQVLVKENDRLKATIKKQQSQIQGAWEKIG
jgi:DNA-binding XRE family transcriptional regulator